MKGVLNIVKLDTVVHPVCEKTGSVHVPDVSVVYAQILAVNNGKYPNILLLPEYKRERGFCRRMLMLKRSLMWGVPS